MQAKKEIIRVLGSSYLGGGHLRTYFLLKGSHTVCAHRIHASIH